MHMIELLKQLLTPKATKVIDDDEEVEVEEDDEDEDGIGRAIGGRPGI